MSIKLGNADVSIALGNTAINKAYMGNDEVYSTAVLPYDSRVEYLQSTGTQWINTNFIPAQDDVRVIVDASTVSGDMLVYGINGTNPRLNLNWYQTTMYLRYRDIASTIAVAFDGARHLIENGIVKKNRRGCKGRAYIFAERYVCRKYYQETRTIWNCQCARTYWRKLYFQGKNL